MENNNETPLWKRVLVKLTSLKTWIAIWAMITFSYMLITKQEAFAELGWGLIVLIGGDITIGLVQKKILK